MSKMGKIYKMIDKNHGYIIDINGNLYLKLIKNIRLKLDIFLNY